MKKRYKKFKKSREYKKYEKRLKALWDKYGYVLIALITGILIGVYFMPRFFK